MTVQVGPVIEGLRHMVAEEMHLLSQELEDSLEAGQVERLELLAKSLDEASELLTRHRAVRPH